jgi:hypothetical protein
MAALDRSIAEYQRLKGQGRFGVADFRYDAAADLYRCPGEAELRPMRGQKRQASGKLAARYVSRRSVCRACPLRARCLAPSGQRREIERWLREDVIERHRARMRSAGEDMMRRRKALAEHPFGTLKCRAADRHFLVRGFAEVRGEWSLMALCYNFSRVLRILGLDRWLAVLALRTRNPRHAVSRPRHRASPTQPVCGRDLPSVPNRPQRCNCATPRVVENILYFLAQPLRCSALRLLYFERDSSFGEAGDFSMVIYSANQEFWKVHTDT